MFSLISVFMGLVKTRDVEHNCRFLLHHFTLYVSTALWRSQLSSSESSGIYLSEIELHMLFHFLMSKIVGH
jgi:hypothetical protein